MNTEKFPVIAAQQEICKAFIELANLLERPLNKYKEDGYILSYNIEFLPYNNGYEIKTNIKTNFYMYVRDLDASKQFILEKLSGFHSFYLNPCSFYDSNISTEHGASIEGQLPNLTKKEEDHWFRDGVKIHSNEDMRQVVKLYFETAKNLLNNF